MSEAASQLQPLYLLADSQLLFWKRQGQLLLESAIAELPPGPQVTAAYIGASNGDRPEFYEICEAALDAAKVADRRMITSPLSPEDRAYLERARLIVLAGGDVRIGWDTFKTTGMNDLILSRYAHGAILVGISAGAIQLGRCAALESPQSSATEMLELFALTSMVIDVHDERADWTRLTRTIRSLNGTASGLGIPSGGGVIFHADKTLEALRRPAHLFQVDGTRVTHTLLPTAERE
ncbi:peptidase [Mycobacteriaceae bacterium 1482268.1]|nr:peptidase [Mycobacteriaceae bacterium 1482268.1]